MIDRASIFARYRWLKPHAEPIRVVMGDDLDAALSTALYLAHHPNACVVGVYHKYTTVHYSSDLNWHKVLDAVWLDLDIYHGECKSLGHHIVRLERRDHLPGFANSFNLNDLFPKSIQSRFKEKYPLGTIHFLMWLYGVEIPETKDADLLVWLADSAYINAQAKAWRKNWKRGSNELDWVERDGFKWNVKS